MKSRTQFFTLLLILFALAACKKDDPAEENPGTGNPTTGSVTFKFENTFGNNPLVLNTQTYTNGVGESFNVTRFNYYISNIVLTANDNSQFVEPASYHLIKAEDAASLQFTIPNVPAKHYESITFMIGVDSTRNVSGAQTGALDPANGHFWSWNSGYIMAKFEGSSPASTATGNMLMYHVGGFSGANSVLKTVSFALPAHAMVSSAKTPQIRISADLQEWFNPGSVSFATMNTVHMPGANAKLVADNYEDMFSVEEVIN